MTACASSRSREKKALLQAGTGLAGLEQELDGRLGLFALDTGSGASLGYRQDERFPLCSTFKVMLVAATLQKSMDIAEVMQQRVFYSARELVSHSPVAERHIDDGMTISELCAATIQHSDNAAANLLMRFVGGPAAVTAFARRLGDQEFRLDRWEPELNSAIPADPRDTTTPAAMARTLQRLLLDDTVLSPSQRDQLSEWMRSSITGIRRIRAGLPEDWDVADKTGSGPYGTANDIAVLWPPHRAPVVLAIYTTQSAEAAVAREDVIALATEVVAQWLG